MGAFSAAFTLSIFFFFKLFDIFLSGEFKRFSNEFMSFVQGEFFGTLEPFSVWCIFSGSSDVPVIGSCLFEKQFFGGGFVMVFWC